MGEMGFRWKKSSMGVVACEEELVEMKKVRVWIEGWRELQGSGRRRSAWSQNQQEREFGGTESNS